MIKQLTLSLLLMFVLICPLKAHRLNEYLQATRITLAKDSVGLHIDLITGTEIAEKLLKEIDKDGDGILSFSEKQLYINKVVRQLSLTIDGDLLSLRINSCYFPGVEEIKNGTGEIQLYLAAPVQSAKAAHQLLFKQQQNLTAVYLVNCLQPSDTSVRITAQSRNSDQSMYTLDFGIGNAPLAGAGVQANSNFTLVKSFFFHGVRHILTGYDHLLFLCALLIGAASLWDLIKIVTAFTIAHSITLTLAALELVHVPSYITEPLIAASIVCIALQNIFRPAASRRTGRVAVVFLFGLFHGLGFAGGLLQLMHAMPRQALIYTLLGFSAGVEAGNQIVLLPLYGIMKSAKHVYANSLNPKKTGTFRLFASAIVAVAGLYYLLISLTF